MPRINKKGSVKKAGSRDEKKLIAVLEKEILKSKTYNKTLKAASKRMVYIAAKTAVMSNEKTCDESSKKTGFDVYCSLISAFSKVRKKYTHFCIKNLGKKNSCTGLWVLKTLKKISKMKKAKRLKPYRVKKRK